jgi:hypothetical protein
MVYAELADLDASTVARGLVVAEAEFTAAVLGMRARSELRFRATCLMKGWSHNRRIYAASLTTILLSLMGSVAGSALPPARSASTSSRVESASASTCS